MSDEITTNFDYSKPVFLPKDLIHCIVDSLEVNTYYQRLIARQEHGKIDDDLVTALDIMRRFENNMNGVDSDYAKISYRI